MPDYCCNSRYINENTQISSHLPPTEERTEGKALGSYPYRFSQYEPAINRYSEGGDFPPHIDGHALTLNTLLCESETFGGQFAMEES